VKAARIPWGSFYQYFNGKEGIFLYMFEEIIKEKREIIRNAKVLDPDADVFEACIRTIKATYEFWKQFSLVGLDEDMFL